MTEQQSIRTARRFAEDARHAIRVESRDAIVAHEIQTTRRRVPRWTFAGMSRVQLFQFLSSHGRLIARRGSARQFLLVSSVGADAQSSNFYLRTKGEAEQAVFRAGFSAIHIFRPSFLLGHRVEDRPVERMTAPFAAALGLLMVGPLRKYKPVEASEVARAMVQAAVMESPGRRIHHFPF